MIKNWRWVIVGTALAAMVTGGMALADGKTSTSTPSTGRPAFGGPRQAGRGPGMRNMGEVKSISGTSITLTAPRGDVTVTTSDQTTYDEGPSLSATFADVQVGERIAVDGTTDTATNTVAATTVHILLPRVHGTVLTRDGNTITVKDKDGIWTVNLSGNPVVHRITGTASLSDITVGQDVEALGQFSANVLTAQAIEIVPVHIDGTVTAKTDTALTLSTARGERTLTIDQATQYAGSLKDQGRNGIKVGDQIMAQAKASGNDLVAGVISARGADQGQGRPGFGGRGDGGPGHGGPGFGGHGEPGFGDQGSGTPQ